MKKIDKKGFMLTELLVTSTLVCTVLIFLYTQFSSVKKSYDNSFKYNTVNGLYALANMREFLIDNDVNTLKYVLEPNLLVNSYVDLKDANNVINAISAPDYWNTLVTKLKVKNIFFTKENLTDLIAKLDVLSDEYEDMKKFIRYIDFNPEGEFYRLIVEYEDHTFATLLIEGD